MIKFRTFLSLLAVATSGMFGGVSCATRSAAPAEYLGDSLEMEKGDSFQRMWVADNVDWSKYSAITVIPVNTNYLSNMSYLDSKSFVNYNDKGVVPKFEKDSNRHFAQELAKFFQKRLIATLKKNHKIEVSDTPHKNAIQIEIAIVELVPIKKLLFALGILGDGSIKGASIAIEGRIRDMQTGEVIAMFADRKVKRFAAPNFNSKDKWSWYPQAKPAVKEWCDLLLKLANKRLGQSK